MHTTFSIVINYLALVCDVWLGWYVVTRSPRKLISWLTGLTLLSLGGLFLNILLALNPLPMPINSPGWLRFLFPFWPTDAFESGWVGWLHGWQVTPAVILWHHVTLLMRPGGLNWWRWTRLIFGYVVAILAILVQVFKPHLLAETFGNPLYLNTIKPGPLYLPFLLILFLFTIFSVINLFRSARAAPSIMPRKQLLTLGAATITAGLTVPVAFISSALKISLPQVILTILLLIAVILIGYGVARYSALIEGRTMRRDFYYNAIAMAQIALIYSFVTWVSVAMFDVPAAAFVFVIVLSIFTHNLVDATRRTLDSIFYRQENRQLRQNLRRLAREGGLQNFEENVTLALESMCNSVRATFGLILLFDDQNLKPIASFNLKKLNISLPVRDFITDDVLQITPDQFPEPLKKAVLLVPLYVDTNQIGVVVLGRPVNSLNYSRDDIELLLYPSDRLAEAIHTAQRETEYLQQLSQLNIPPKTQHQIPVKEVENALRNLYNYALLGDTPFSKLRLVGAKLSPDAVTHIDRGKAVYQVMVEAIEKLRPDADPPRDPPPREWHPYVILHGAYVEEKLNRDIMSQLYISEGTFNRTRRGAVRSVARILDELETKTH